jgi:anti-sigma factor RsiW
MRLGWNKAPSSVFSFLCLPLRPTAARGQQPVSKTDTLQKESRMGIDDTDLLAYTDGHLPQARRAEVEKLVASSPDVAARLSAMRASALPYARAFEAQVLPPVPAELSQHIGDLLVADARRRQRRASSWPQVASAFAAGALCCALALRLLSSAAPPQVAVAQVSPWIKAVADYQQLYSRATLANVTEDPALSAHVINDLRVQDGIAVVVPDLRSAALTFKRVQRLSFHEQPVVQMVYLPEHGEPIALCVTPDARPDETPHAQPVGELNGVAWRRDNLGYVVLGRVPARALLDLGRRIASGSTSRLYGRSGTPPVRRAA